MIKMNKTNIIALSAGLLVALIAVTGIAITTYAQDAVSDSTVIQGPYHMRFWDQLSDNSKTEIQNLIDSNQAEREANREKISDALSQSYDKWAAAVKEVMGDSAPILDKVNADNFGQYQAAQDYIQVARDNMEKAGEIYQNIGIGGGFGFGHHMGMHGMRGYGMGFMGKFVPTTGNTQTQ